jgi:hypothetical protein
LSATELSIIVRTEDQATSGLKKIGSSIKDATKTFAALGSSAMGIYSAFERVQDASLSLDKANLKVKSSANSLEDANLRQKNTAKDLEEAQLAVSKAIEETGEDSDETRKAQEKLQTAIEKNGQATDDAKLSLERYSVATETAKDAQEKLNTSMATSVFQGATSAITFADNIGKVATSLRDLGTAADTANAAAGTTGLMGTLNKLKGVGVITIGIAFALVAGYVVADILAKNVLPQRTATGMPTYYEQFPELKKRWEAENPQAVAATSTPKIPLPKSYWKQHGGIFDKATIIGVGEAGPEAVIPLDQGVASTVSTVVHIHFEGPVYGLQDFEEKVREIADQGIAEGLRRRGR